MFVARRLPTTVLPPDFLLAAALRRAAAAAPVLTELLELDTRLEDFGSFALLTRPSFAPEPRRLFTSS